MKSPNADVAEYLHKRIQELRRYVPETPEGRKQRDAVILELTLKIEELEAA